MSQGFLPISVSAVVEAGCYCRASLRHERTSLHELAGFRAVSSSRDTTTTQYLGEDFGRQCEAHRFPVHAGARRNIGSEKPSPNQCRLRGGLGIWNRWASLRAERHSKGQPVRPQRQPNIVVILADDLGNADLGYRGSDIRTPNIDALAKGGVRLESFYGMPVCTPARAALMTGRYAMRYGLQTLVIFPSHTYGLPTEERTLPQALKEAGYRTAMVGKWHLGHADQKYWPQNRGFDHFYGNLVGEVDYFSKERGGLIDWQRNGQFLKEDGYFTTLIGDEAVRLIDGARWHQAALSLCGVAGAACALSGTPGLHRPLQG